MEYKDYYRIMGVDRQATAEQIKRAYRKLARKFHPDVSKEANAEARFKEINEAYEVLKDPEKRTAYDQLGARWRAGEEFRPPPDWQGQQQANDYSFTGVDAAGFSDFFQTLFGADLFTRAQSRRGNRAAAGMHQFARIELTLEEAYAGAARSLTLAPDYAELTAGAGEPRTLNVRIPAGVLPGQQIRLAGQGAPGMGGGPAGDLYLEVVLAPHRLFRLEGRDVHLDLPVAPWEAALGATVSVPTLGGAVELKIPPDSQSGRRLRLKGRGMPGDPAGDQYLRLAIVTPAARTAEQRELYERMRRDFAFDPRSAI